MEFVRCSLAQNQFIHAVCENYPLNKTFFRLSPVYTFYMALRYRLCSRIQSVQSLTEKQENIVEFLNRIEETIEQRIEVISSYERRKSRSCFPLSRIVMIISLILPIGWRTHRNCSSLSNTIVILFIFHETFNIVY
jgi:hypothetical protein